jgi:group I intron endonuclease
MGYIYKITNTVNGKCYIGETTMSTPERRWSHHRNSLESAIGCPALKASMKKHGVKKFKFELLIICFDQDVFKYEKEYIKKYNSIIPNGYNMNAGGTLGETRKGVKHTPETILKIKEGLKKFKEENPNHYETYRERHQATMKTIDISACIKNSERHKKAKEEKRLGAYSHKNKNKNGTLSEETKAKIKNSVIKYYEQNGVDTKNNVIEKHRIAMAKANGKPVSQYTKDGIFIKEYISAAAAERELNVKKGNINQMIRGLTKTAYGFVWKYTEPKDPMSE